MEKKVTFDCKNNGRVVEVPFATTLEEAYAYTGVQMKYGAAAADEIYELPR